MNPIIAFPVSRTEADQIRASRGFASFQTWATQNKAASKEHRTKGKPELADALDREYVRYIAKNI